MAPQPASRTTATNCCIVGGGPAGMMLGYLLARAGITVTVLEKHGDFLRDFRGDTVHPSTLELLSELGLLDGFLARPHQEMRRVRAEIEGKMYAIADFTRLDAACPFIALMPQWDFLDFLVDQARVFPNFRLAMSTEGIGLITDGERVTGIRARDAHGDFSIRANLVVAADGRHSVMRQQAGLAVRDIGAPIDVLWFRVGRIDDSTEQTLGRLDTGRVLITIDRGTYWQCAYVIPKGSAAQWQARPLAEFKQSVVAAAGYLGAHIDDVTSWDDVKLLSVSVDRLEQWAKPGLLCIGDAAHAMSPIGGVGINMAIQDAVAAANLLWQPLGRHAPSLAELAAVQRRRQFPVRLTQGFQVMIQNRVLAPTLAGRRLKVPVLIHLLTRWPWLQRQAARFIGLGVRPEHIDIPQVTPPAD